MSALITREPSMSYWAAQINVELLRRRWELLNIIDAVHPLA